MSMPALRTLCLLACAVLLFALPAGAQSTPASAECTLFEDPIMLDAADYAALIDFRQPDELAAWAVVDDGVMGGVSRGRFGADPDGAGALFSGTVRLENNGGFSSLQRWFNPVNLSEFDGIELDVCGDGQRYAFSLRDIHSRRVLHESRFTTEVGVWQRVRLPFSALVPQIFGQRVQTGPIDTVHIIGMNIIISDRQAGEFALRIGRIGVYREAPSV